MSRMPGRGVGAVVIVTGSVSRRLGSQSRLSGPRQRRRGDRYRVTAERQHPVERVTELPTEAVEARVRDPHKAFDFDQVDGSTDMLTGGKEGAAQPEGREHPEDPAPTDVRRGFGHQQSTIRAGLLLRPAADRERIGAIAARVAAGAEW